MHGLRNAGVGTGIGSGPKRWAAADARLSCSKIDSCEVRGGRRREGRCCIARGRQHTTASSPVRALGVAVDRCMIARVQKEEEGRRGHARWSLATYLGLCGRVLILAVGGGAQGGTRSVLASADASSLCQVLLTLCLSNLNLLLLATAAKLIWLEGVLGFELGPSVLGDVALSHGCDAAALCCDVGVLTFCWRGIESTTG